MIYELWDTRSRNLIGTYDTEEAALEVVCQVASAHGWGAAEALALGQEDKAGRSCLRATGRDLAKRARDVGKRGAVSSS